MPEQPLLVKYGNWWKQEWPWQKEKKKAPQEGGEPASGSPPGKFNGLDAVPSLSDKWRLVDLFLEYKGLVTQHIDSYNYFVSTQIHDIVAASTNVQILSNADPKWFLRFENVTIGKPSIKEDMVLTETNPQMCRLRDMSYQAPVFMDIRYWRGTEVLIRRKVEICRLPVMLRSVLCVLHGKSDAEKERLGECPYDPGGYFVIKGVERVLMMQEQGLTNRIIVEYDVHKILQAVVTSSSTENKSRTTVCLDPTERKKGIFFKHSGFQGEIPVSIILKAMGVQSDMEIFQVVGIERIYMDGLMPTLKASHEIGIFSQIAALDYLQPKVKMKDWQKDKKPGTFKITTPLEILQFQVLSHIKCPGDNLAHKIRYLGLMIRRLLSARQDPSLIDDRDYYGNKRIELSGGLLAVLFEDQFKGLSNILRERMDLAIGKFFAGTGGKRQDFSKYPDVMELWADGTDKFTKAFNYAISTGNWRIQRYRIDRSGCSQVLSRLSYMSSVGSMMRVRSQFEKTRKVGGPRMLQPSQWGMLCPADTPEGEQCGLVKHLSLLTHITTGESQESLRQICYCLGVEDVLAMSGEEMHAKGNYLVFLNGNILGIHRRPKKFMSNLQKLRRSGRVGEFVSIYEHEGWNAVIIASDSGRLCRPLLIVADGKPRFDPAKHVPLLLKKPSEGGMAFADFLKQGIVEWVDVNEENNLFIALRLEDIKPETTHLEIEALTLLGVISGLIPYPDHNQSPRNTYECAMGKQAMGCVAMNMYSRNDKELLGLCYPQKPLCTSKTCNLVKFHHLGAGQNASVAVMSYSGYDIEDAIVMNRAALDRGFGRCFVMRRMQVKMESYQNSLQDLLAPPPSQDAGKLKTPGGGRGTQLKYSQLGDEGLVNVGSKLEDGMFIANKISPIETHRMMDMNADHDYKATPVSYKSPAAAYVDRVILTTDGDGVTEYKVVTRQTRRPEIGDKFASRHGQKGVVGIIVPEEDLPFSETGWRPDLIMNPHGFPSRMTVGKMLELIGSKAGVLDGVFANGSAFGGTPAGEIYETLIRHGFAPTGKDMLTSGITGEPMESYIFCGPIYYQKLKHMVVDKLHARATGPRMSLTRQPTEGKAKQGGMRLGEMERDCLVAYGASNLLLERLMLSSDPCTPPVCRKCGLFAARSDWCQFCNSAAYVTNVRMPYACKLLFQELQSMNVCCKLSLAEQ